MPGQLAPPAQQQGQDQGPLANPAIPTSMAIDAQWVVVGLANSRIHIFSARTGVLSRTLIGHDSGVWAVALISEGGQPVGRDPCMHPLEGDPLVASHPQDEALPLALRTAVGLDKSTNISKVRLRPRSVPDPFADGGKAERPRFGKPSYPGGASDGWGQPNALVVSGGCDKELRVWDVKTGCVYSRGNAHRGWLTNAAQVLRIHSSRPHIHHPLPEGGARASTRRLRLARSDRARVGRPARASPPRARGPHAERALSRRVRQPDR